MKFLKAKAIDKVIKTKLASLDDTFHKTMEPFNKNDKQH